MTVGALVRSPSYPSFNPASYLGTILERRVNGASTQYGLGGLRIRNRQPYGVEMALLASLVLAGSSVPRAIKTQKALPIGLSVVAAFGLYRFGTVWRAQA